ncbi:hypothetical protein J4H86_18810 [Spiractinospora alimapuensis]|uniref:hypothetical protein n=1 Tax=Spiractinospora alimapuensis TaxID=2820884 RepID=UPI001F38E921|nr:hypothetical protein [Spiractinospora alimapuensis]QVQ50896.1 hypothetical protein J4H86_18810 [Spiractinospora alimapuensis]
MTRAHDRPTFPRAGDQDTSRRSARVLVVVAVVVAVLELGATIGSVGGEPFAPVEGWTPTRATDLWAFALLVVGCGALFGLRRSPSLATAVAAVAYGAFMLLGYEFGMSLPAMAAVFLLVAWGGSRTVAVVAAMACLASTLLWVNTRAEGVADPGVSMLIWVAFGTVAAVFFYAPILVAEIVRTRRLLTRGAPASQESAS